MTARTFTQAKGKAAEKIQEAVATGPAAAAMIASGIGAFVIGLMTTLAEAIPALKTALNWLNPVGPLSGKTSVGVVAWLITWFLLNTVMKDKDSDLVKAFTITILLLIVGLVLTFPPFFEAFTVE